MSPKRLAGCQVRQIPRLGGTTAQASKKTTQPNGATRHGHAGPGSASSSGPAPARWGHTQGEPGGGRGQGRELPGAPKMLARPLQAAQAVPQAGSS